MASLLLFALGPRWSRMTWFPEESRGGHGEWRDQQEQTYGCHSVGQVGDRSSNSSAWPEPGQGIWTSPSGTGESHLDHSGF